MATGTVGDVLVIRLDAIGDAVALTPLLHALAARGLAVDAVLTARNAEIFSARALRRRFVAPFALRSGSSANRAAIRDFARELGDRYTHVLVATEDENGYRLARALDAPVRIGFANGWGKPFKTAWVRGHLDRVVHRSAGLDPAGPHEAEVLWRLGRELVGDATPSRDARALAPLLLDAPAEPRDPVVFQATTKWARLGIPFERVVATVAELTRRAPLRLIASADERDDAQRLADATGVPLESFETLRAWTSAIASAAALVAPDSGAIHIGGMLGRPVVAVFPPSRHFSLQVARWRPWAAPHRIVRAEATLANDVAGALDALRAGA